MNMKEKLTSRKFWLSFASFLGSLGTAFAGLSSENEVLIILGIVCATVSTCIYSICEAMVDKNAIGSNESEG